MDSFIAYDHCGWDNRHSRYTHMPSGDTLVQQAWMSKTNWDQAQLDYLRKYPGLTVYSCPTGPYSKAGTVMGKTEDICKILMLS